MRSKKHIKTVINNEILLIKSMKIIFISVTLLTCLAFPVLFYMIYMVKPDLFSSYVTEISQYCFPFFSALLTVFILKNYIDNYNCEIYFLYSKSKISEVLLILMFYDIILLIPFLICSFCEKNMMFEYIRIISQCFLFSSSAYMIMFITMSASVTIIPLFVYLMFSIYNMSDKQKFFIFCSFEEMNSSNIIINIIPIIVAGIVFYAGGIFINRIRSTRYSAKF